jgi:DnaJ-class molecular chaperone
MAEIAASSGSSSSGSSGSSEEEEQEQEEESVDTTITTITLTCPPDTRSGESIVVETEDGEMDITIPEGVEPGDEFDIDIVTNSGGGAGDGPEAEGVREEYSYDGAGNAITVTCPAGVTVGDSIFVETGDGEIEVTIPEGVEPGDEFDVVLS